MSTDRVIGFLHDLIGDPLITKKVSAVEPTAEAWIAVANESGYVFDEEDLKLVAEELAEHPLGDDFVPELITVLTAGPRHIDEESDVLSFTSHGIGRLKAVMQQGRYSGYYRPW
jgi:hypothetical protein